MATSKKDRGAPSGSTRGEKTASGNGASTQRRGKNEPGHYQAPEEESERTIDGDADASQTRATDTSRNMESAFDDEDMQNEMLDDYDLDDADGDVDWDDSMPARGGGKSPDE